MKCQFPKCKEPGLDVKDSPVKLCSAHRDELEALIAADLDVPENFEKMMKFTMKITLNNILNNPNDIMNLQKGTKAIMGMKGKTVKEVLNGRK